MDIRQLRCLLAIVDEGSFSSAGRRLGMAQPAVSAQIQRLEREIGDQVFFRDGRTVSLTAVGEVMVPHARAAIRAMRDAEAAAQAARGVVSGTVTFGAMPGCGGLGVPEMLYAFREAFPQISLRVIEASAHELIRQVTHGDIDVALVGTPSPSTHGLPARVIVEERLVAVAPATGAPVSSEAIALQTLLEREIMCTPKGSGIRSALELAARARQLPITIRYESGNPDMLVAFAASGLGVAVVPDASSIRSRRDVVVLDIVEPCVLGRLELVWSTKCAVSPAVRELIRVAEVLGTDPLS